MLIEEIIDRYDKPTWRGTLDAIKELGFHFATRAGLTIGLEDVKTPPEKVADPRASSRTGPPRSSRCTRRV